MNDIVHNIINSGLTRADICRICNVSRSTVSRWVNENRCPSSKNKKLLEDYIIEHSSDTSMSVRSLALANTMLRRDISNLKEENNILRECIGKLLYTTLVYGRFAV